MDVKNLKEDGDLQVCLVLFDIIYLNGQVVLFVFKNEGLKYLKIALL